MTDKTIYPDDEMTNIDGIWVCNNCGAYAEKKEDIEHFPSCTPGESKKWEEFYNERRQENGKN